MRGCAAIKLRSKCFFTYSIDLLFKIFKINVARPNRGNTLYLFFYSASFAFIYSFFVVFLIKYFVLAFNFTQQRPHISYAHCPWS